MTEQETQPSCTIFFSLGALLKLSQNQFKRQFSTKGICNQHTPEIEEKGHFSGKRKKEKKTVRRNSIGFQIVSQNLIGN